MAVFGWVVISLILMSAVAGAIAACRDDEKGLGREFLEGIYAIGYIFLPVAGIMASAPFLAQFVSAVFGPLFGFVGADDAMAATTFIAIDMGGFILAKELADSTENWITAMTIGYMAGATIVFSIPVGLAMLQKRDHKYMALGVMAGLLSIPIGVLVANLLIWIATPNVRSTISTSTEADHALSLSLAQVLMNLAPLAIITSSLALGLRFFPDQMIQLFMGFGRLMGILIKLVLVACIVEYFTAATFGMGLFTRLLGSWGFEPVIVNAEQVQELAKTPGRLEEGHILRALEVAGYIGIMLAGAFPMVYLLRKYLSKPIESVGRRIGLDANGAAGILAAAANILAMFRLVNDMRPRDKVLCIAFAVCAAFTFGDHLAFTTNFQPNLLLPVMLGKLTGGAAGFLIATWLCLPKARQLEQQDMIDDAKSVLEHIPSMKGKPLGITVLKGGMTNRIFKVTVGGDAFVLRLFGYGTDLLGIDRDREVACSQAVAATDLGAIVFDFLPTLDPKPFPDFSGALLVSFVPGKQLQPESVNDPAILERIGKTLKCCHQTPIDEKVTPFDVIHTIRDYAVKASERDVKLPAAWQDALAQLQRLEAELAKDAPAPCLCHNDLLAGNFMDDGTTMRIIDWEYGGRGDPYFDLGNFAANMKLDEAQETAFLAAYFGDVTPAIRRRVRIMRVISDLREASWGFLQQAISKLDAPQEFESYLAYGETHLRRALETSTTT